jgi:hypothetical protein
MMRISNVKCQVSNAGFGRSILPRALTACCILLLLVSCQNQNATPPRVLSVWPPADTTGIPPDAALQIEFSSPMDEYPTEFAFQIQPYSQGAVHWQGNTLVYHHEWVGLALHTQYTMTEGTGAQDQNGTPLANPLNTSFTTADSAIFGDQVYLLGRSVMAGWFDHWGYDTLWRERFTIAYREVQPPPDIVTSVMDVVNQRGVPGPVISFQLSFEDFAGGDSATAWANLERNMDIVQQVYDTVVVSRGLRLVIGGALPQVASATDAWLVWNHTTYNARLASFASQHDGVRVFDLYGILSDTGGSLRSSYAASSTNSHLNEQAYTALDEQWFSFLEQNY